MLVDDTMDKKLLDLDDHPQQPPQPEAGPSASASTSTSAPVASKGGAALENTDYFVPPGGEAPPPDFTPYVADYFDTSDGSIVSHDPHLNEDGEALYRFLLSQSQIPPQLLLHVHGQHDEHRSRSVRRVDDRGHAHWHTETETVTVVDFDFQIDVSQHIMQRPTQWSVPDEEPAYRGSMKQEVDGILIPSRVESQDALLENGRRRRWIANSVEKKQAKAWREERALRGLPPWVGSHTRPPIGGVANPANANMSETDVLRSSKSVREWADEYCASHKMLKEFTYKKVVYGWNLAAVQAAVAAAVKSTYYNGRMTVQFKQRSDTIHIRADNWLSRTLSRTWLVVLLWITLIYPFIWLFKRFTSGGGGRWEVCGGAYALKSWRMIPPSEDGDALDPPPPFSEHNNHYTYTHNGRTVVNTPMGQAELVGTREGEWFQRWEGTIKRAVMGRCQSALPLTMPDDNPLVAAVMLDGYNPQPPQPYLPMPVPTASLIG